MNPGTSAEEPVMNNEPQEPQGFPYEIAFVTTFSLSLGLVLGRDGVPQAPANVPESTAERISKMIAVLAPDDVLANVSGFSGTSDTVYADVIASIANRGIVVEFKRDLNEWTTERSKPVKRKVLSWITGRKFVEKTKVWEPRSAGIDPTADEVLSRRVHWFAYGAHLDDNDQSDNMMPPEDLDIRFSAYANVVEGKNEIEGDAIFLNDFLNFFLRGDVGVALHELERYLEEMQKNGGADNAADASTAGVLVRFDRTGRPRLTWFRSIKQLKHLVSGLVQRGALLPDPKAGTHASTPGEPEQRTGADFPEHPRMYSDKAVKGNQTHSPGGTTPKI